MHQPGLKPRPSDEQSHDHLQYTVTPNWNMNTMISIVFNDIQNIFLIQKKKLIYWFVSNKKLINKIIK